MMRSSSFFFFFAFLGLVAAENSLDGWLRYAPVPCTTQCRFKLPANIVALNATKTSPVYVAGSELRDGLKGIYDAKIDVTHDRCKNSSVIVGTVEQYRKACGSLNGIPQLDEDGFWLNTPRQRRSHRRSQRKRSSVRCLRIFVDARARKLF